MRCASLLAPLLIPLALAVPAAAQPAAGISEPLRGAWPEPLRGAWPEPLRGAWVEGAACDRPAPLLVLTGRAAVQLPPGGAPVLLRFASLGPVAGGWILGTMPGAEGRRLALRSPGADTLETVEPAAKTRDDRLPGEGSPVRRWRRCPLPAAAALPHAEGIAILAALEPVEAACAEGAGLRTCLAALHQQADITGDGLLSPAEVARLARGAAWIAAAEQGRAVEPAASGRAALATARMLLESLDYDADGRLSLAELAQDRAAPGAAAGGGQGLLLGAVPAGEAGLAALRLLLEGRPAVP